MVVNARRHSSATASVRFLACDETLDDIDANARIVVSSPSRFLAIDDAWLIKATLFANSSSKSG